MSGSGGENRTEAATPRRLQRAREEGQAPVSMEVAPLLVLAGLALLLLFGAPAGAGGRLGALLQPGGAGDPAAVAAALGRAARVGFGLLAKVLLVAVAAPVASVVLQTGFLLHPGAVVPDVARISPGRGVRRIFSPARFTALATGVIKAAVLAVALWQVLWRHLPALGAAALQPVGDLTGAVRHGVAALLLVALTLQALLAAADMVLTRLRFARGLRMSREEVRTEQREANGSPEVKARLRRLRAQRARRRMAAAVKHATVVVTNPTHYAVALSYDRARGGAPRVVAKGMDEMAGRIRAVAEENKVPLVSNPPLARALHRVEIDAEIPPELYQAVAELIAFVWRVQARAGRPR